MYAVRNRRNSGKAKLRRQFLDWYVISRKTFYQIVGVFLGVILLTGGVIVWKRSGQRIVAQMERQGARLVKVAGAVSIHRAKTNRIERAEDSMTIEAGDMIVTASDATAVIQYIDGSVLRANADATVIVKENAQSVERGDGRIVKNQLVSGVVSLSTSSSAPEDVNELISKNFTFRPSANTQATVSTFGETTKATVDRGSLSGTTIQGNVTEVIPSNVTVEFAGERKISQIVLSPAPVLRSPNGGEQMTLAPGRPAAVTFAWSSVPDASGYQIQIADSPYFFNKALRIDASVKDGTAFVWRINSIEGDYWWRVQAVGRDGRGGVWSEQSRVSLTLNSETTDGTPIPIDESTVTRIAPGLYDVSGTTEPGVRLTVNGRPVTVDGDGRYSVRVEGRGPIRILAQDARGRMGRRIVFP
jgi:hypothetical protein